MEENTLPLIFIFIGGFLIDLGFLYLHALKSFSLIILIPGIMLFWRGFTRLQ